MKQMGVGEVGGGDGVNLPPLPPYPPFTLRNELQPLGYFIKLSRIDLSSHCPVGVIFFWPAVAKLEFKIGLKLAEMGWFG